MQYSTDETVDIIQQNVTCNGRLRLGLQSHSAAGLFIQRADRCIIRCGSIIIPQSQASQRLMDW